MDTSYDPELVDAIYNTCSDWQSAQVSNGKLVFYRDGKLYRLPLRHSNDAPLLQRVCPSWVSMHHVLHGV